MYLRDTDRTTARVRRTLIALQGGRSAQAMATIIGAKSANTWLARVRNPGTMTLAELSRLCNECGSTPATVMTGKITF